MEWLIPFISKQCLFFDWLIFHVKCSFLWCVTYLVNFLFSHPYIYICIISFTLAYPFSYSALLHLLCIMLVQSIPCASSYIISFTIILYVQCTNLFYMYFTSINPLLFYLMLLISSNNFSGKLEVTYILNICRW